ncbi:hypothetical protein V6N13_011051 [Hibiscus sabdariffa]|uniref:Uncharacterized protein n=1 Tax=Hibiscus sabdariffa TaxID=183260 RepID=A0ABR2SBC2_9ROSI
MSLVAEQGLNLLGKCLKLRRGDALFEALQKVKEDLYHHPMLFIQQAQGRWRKAAIVCWTRSFFKQFCGSVTESEYIALGQVFIKLLLVVGAKLEHITIQLAQDMSEMIERHRPARIRPSDERFWFKNPAFIFHLIHFISFQNVFELAFFFWILVCLLSVIVANT